MFLQMKYTPKNYDTLKSLVVPASAKQPECLPWVMYDTIQYAAAGQARLAYFTGTNPADLTMSNLPDGKLETLQYFEIHRVFTLILTLLSITTTAVVTGAANDVIILHSTGRGIWTFSMTNKIWGPFPLEFFGRPGGPAVFIAMEGTETAPARNFLQFGTQNENGGFPGLGAMIVPPVTQFKTFLDFNSTAIAAAVNIRQSLMGVLHRRVT